MSLKRIAVLFLALFAFCFAACKQVVEVEKIVVNEKGAFSAGHEAGDVLWNDGTWSAKAEVASLTALPDGKKPIGVLAFEKGGVPYCVGLAIDTSKMWAASGSTGYSINIIVLQGNVFGEGETDGSKSLAALKAACSKPIRSARNMAMPLGAFCMVCNAFRHSTKRIQSLKARTSATCCFLLPRTCASYSS